MTSDFRANGAAFLGFALLLLLAVGLYQRIANPSLTYHLDAQQHAPAPAADHDHPPLAPEDAEKLGNAMTRLRENPADAELLLSIADIFGRNKDWRNALGFLERAAEVAPKDFRPQYLRGITLANMNEHARAAEAFEKALELDATNTRSRFNLAVLYRYYLNKPEKARELLRDVASSPLADPALREQAKKELER